MYIVWLCVVFSKFFKYIHLRFFKHSFLDENYIMTNVFDKLSLVFRIEDIYFDIFT